MKFYFAPLEGLSGYRYRNLHREFFPGVDLYFTPFIVPCESGITRLKERSDIVPEHNEKVSLIPQLLTNNPDHFLRAAEQIAELGYEEVNLNLGCPSGTVTKKGRGAGFLREENREALKNFLDEIFEKAPIHISVKTRIGWEEPLEAEALFSLLEQYPISELTIHPRTAVEKYSGTPHREVFGGIYRKSRLPLCYNGDIRTENDYQSLVKEFPNLNAVMVGRGLIANPGLVTSLCGGMVTKEQMRRFYDALFDTYREEWLQGDVQLMQKMKEIWSYMATSFTNYEKYLKAIKKARRLEDYRTAVSRLFEEQELVEK